MRGVLAQLFRRARRTRPQRAALQLLSLEGRDVPSSTFAATGAAAGTFPVVTVQRPDGTVLARFLAYDSVFLGGVNAETAELDGNPNTIEVVTGAGPGGGPHVKVFSIDETNGTVSTLASFFAYSPTFTGGVDVAAGNMQNALMGPVLPVFVTGAGPGGGPHVRSFTLVNGAVQQLMSPNGSFMAFDPTFTGGVSVAIGNYDGDLSNGDELAVGAGPGGGPHVKIIGPTGAVTQSFMAFNINFRGGVSLGAGPMVGIFGMDNLFIAAGPGLGSQVNVLGWNQQGITSFNAFDPSFQGGVAVESVTPTQVVLRALGGSGAFTGFGMSSTGGADNPTVLARGQAGLPMGAAPFGSADVNAPGGIPGYTMATFDDSAGLNPFNQTGLTINSSTPVGQNLV
jgi:hypothetical protein